MLSLAYLLSFVCVNCKNQKHGKCPGGTWCDCLHRAPRVPDEELKHGVQ